MKTRNLVGLTVGATLLTELILFSGFVAYDFERQSIEASAAMGCIEKPDGTFTVECVMWGPPSYWFAESQDRRILAQYPDGSLGYTMEEARERANQMHGGQYASTA